MLEEEEEMLPRFDYTLHCYLTTGASSEDEAPTTPRTEVVVLNLEPLQARRLATMSAVPAEI